MKKNKNVMCIKIKNRGLFHRIYLTLFKWLKLLCKTYLIFIIAYYYYCTINDCYYVQLTTVSNYVSSNKAVIFIDQGFLFWSI